MTKVKPMKGLKQAHTSNDKIGRGFQDGSAIKNPVAKLKLSHMMDMPKKAKNSMGKPPKSLA